MVLFDRKESTQWGHFTGRPGCQVLPSEESGCTAQRESPGQAKEAPSGLFHREISFVFQPLCLRSWLSVLPATLRSLRTVDSAVVPWKTATFGPGSSVGEGQPLASSRLFAFVTGPRVIIREANTRKDRGPLLAETHEELKRQVLTHTYAPSCLSYVLLSLYRVLRGLLIG